jgi:hypothetical protein
MQPVEVVVDQVGHGTALLVESGMCGITGLNEGTFGESTDSRRGPVLMSQIVTSSAEPLVT